MLNSPVNGKIQGLFKAFESFSSTFLGKSYFQRLFKTVLHIQVLFKPVQTLLYEHKLILSTRIKLPFVIKTFVLSFFEWPLRTGFTVCVKILNLTKNNILSFHLPVLSRGKATNLILLCFANRRFKYT